jgi:uncharacterized protein (TIGR02453 family)
MPPRFRGFPEEGLRFLSGLKKNNKREWFQKRKEVYIATVKNPMASFIMAVSADLDKFAPEMIGSPKISAYRIYRDTRFSPNKAPYKTHVAAVFPRRGLEKHAGAGLYVHIASDEVFVGGGLFRPVSADLQALREYIAVNHVSFRSTIGSQKFRKFFGMLSGDQLTRVPRGFAKDHPAADLLRYKQFLASRRFEPELVTTPTFYPEVIRTFKTLLPMIRYLNEPIAGRRRHSDRSVARDR